jgi:hypothetical protein
MASSAQFAAEVASMVGVRWRRHGRDPARGLDCAGPAIAALRRCGIEPVDSRDYDALRPDDEMLWRLCRSNGEGQGWDDRGEGRLGLCAWEPGGCARHLVVMVGNREIVHVDASVRSVVRVPGDWMYGRLLAVFRLHGVSYGAPW